MPRGGGIGRLLKQLKTDDWIGRVVDKHFSTKYPASWNGKPSPNIHPSGAGSVCERNIELAMLGHKTEVSGQSRRRMDRGTSAHDRWERYLGEMGILLKAEHPLKLVDPMVSARIDAVVQHPISGSLAVIELKTVHSHGFSRLPPNTQDRRVNMAALYRWNPPWGRWYCIQLTWYYSKGDYKGTRFREAAFLFENNDTQEYRVIYVEPGDELIQEALRRPVMAQEAFLRGELADRPYKRGSATCKKCEREGVCDLLESGDKDLWLTVKAQMKKAGIRAQKQKS